MTPQFPDRNRDLCLDGYFTNTSIRVRATHVSTNHVFQLS